MTLTAVRAKCDALSEGRAASDWGMFALPCQSRRGLRSFVDAAGTVRYFCAAPGHQRNVERRFGRRPELESEKVRVERAIERITAEFDAYMGEDDEEPEFDREGQPEFNGSFR